jgi:hypothetical protein
MTLFITTLRQTSTKKKKTLLYLKETNLKHPQANEPLTKHLIRKLQWYYIWYFSTVGFEKLIEVVYNITDPDSFTFSSSYQMIQEKSKNWKSKSLSKVSVYLGRLRLFHSLIIYNVNKQEHVRYEISKSHLNLAANSKENSLYLYFHDAFSEESFIWIKRILNIGLSRQHSANISFLYFNFL